MQAPITEYTLIVIDIDTTGHRLTDEIVQLAAYTCNNHFEQYIMPHGNLSFAARQRYQIRIISIGVNRVLKSIQTSEMIKCQSEITTFKDFLDWLENVKAKDSLSKGIILLYYENRKLIPYMILKSLQKYDLLDRFSNIVKYFVNGYYISLLARIYNSRVKRLFDCISPRTNGYRIKPIYGNAAIRAKHVYEAALLLYNQHNQVNLNSINIDERILIILTPHICSIENDMRELEIQDENMKRQHSFRPVFLKYFKSNRYHRMRAVKFRYILAECGLDLESLRAVWLQKKREGIKQKLNQIKCISFKDINELSDLFDSYFKTFMPINKENRFYNGHQVLQDINGQNAINDRCVDIVTSGVSKDQGVGTNESTMPCKVE